MTMKGVIDIEFILAIVIFVSTISFVSFTIISNIPVFHNQANSEDLRSRAYQISEQLIFSSGEPQNWDATNAKTIGLSTGYAYILSNSKITSLAAMCSSNYTYVKYMLGQDYRNDIIINITSLAGVSKLNCPSTGRKVAPKPASSEFEIVRFATLDDKSIVKIDIKIF